MSTNAMICRKKPDGSLEGIYCNWDGYPEHAGRILRDDYSAPAKIEALFALGDLSELYADPGEPPVGHTYDRPVKGFCIAYARDRGEVMAEVAAEDYLSLEDALDGSDADYSYLWTEADGWRCVGRKGRREDIAIPA